MIRKILQGFVVQDAAQEYHHDHWNKSQATCTLHLFVAYYKKEGESMQACVSSATTFVMTQKWYIGFQQEVLTHMKQVLSPDVKMYYFSDGAASQYENFTNFCNLVFHEEDFGISEEWHFLQLVMAKMLVMVWVA